MAYSSTALVNALIPNRTISATSKPTTTQVDSLRAMASGELDAALQSRGHTVPITAPAAAVTDLDNLVAQLVAPWVERAFQQGNTANEQGALGAWLTDARKVAGDVREGRRPIIGLTEPDGALPQIGPEEIRAGGDDEDPAFTVAGKL